MKLFYFLFFCLFFFKTVYGISNERKISQYRNRNTVNMIAWSVESGKKIKLIYLSIVNMLFVAILQTIC